VTVRIPVALFIVPVTNTCLSLNLFRSIDLGTSNTISEPFRWASKYVVWLPTAMRRVPERFTVICGLTDGDGVGFGDALIIGVGVGRTLFRLATRKRL